MALSPWSVLHAATLAALAATATAQDAPPEPAQDPLRAAREATAAWLASDLADQTLLDRAVGAVVAAGEPGLRLVAGALAELRPESPRERRAAIDTLVSNAILKILDERSSSGMVFAGQYDDLRVLQPASGRFLTMLVLDTPDWFPDDLRALVVPALRDVYPGSPGDGALARFAEIVEDEDFEAQALREALTYALAQWGRRSYVQARIDELTSHAGEGRNGDELHFVRLLAFLHYQLRDYATAAATWERFLNGCRAIEQRASPADEYNAACSLALAGRTDDALAAIERCAAGIAAGQDDSPQPLSRTMFDTDPDLRAIRPHERFAAAVRTAFGERKVDAGADGETGRSGR
ncbi:MAG: hypothetical protein IPM29_31960 [Planctomycetes bacterium]|nr:hypothetical protein [Planctomycetota bacterium]